MIRISSLAVALLFASVSAAYAQTSGQPTQPASQGATSVEKNLVANKSDGKADKGLNNAEAHITATHGKAEKSKGMAEKAEHAEKPEHPAKPERPAR